MTLQLFLNIMWWFGVISIVLILGTFAILLSIFFIASAMYIIPSKQRKIDLKAIAEIKVQQRIYLDEYQFTIANAQHQKVIDEKEKREKEIDSNIRKKSAELKSITAQVDNALKGKKKTSTATAEKA